MEICGNMRRLRIGEEKRERIKKIERRHHRMKI